MTKITENEIELFAIELFEKLGYNYIYAPELERNHEDVLLKDRLLNAAWKINPSLPQSAIEDAIKQIERIKSSELLSDNETFHKLLVEGVKVDVQRDGITRGEIVHLVDFNDVSNNDFVVANQFTITPFLWYNFKIILEVSMKPQKIHWKRTFFALYFGQFFSLLSSSAVQFALIWHLTDTTNGSALVLTLAGLAGFLPQALIGPFAGAVADRYSRKTVMIAADGVVALAALALFAAMSLGEPSVMLILAVLAVRSLATAFHLPAMQASVPLMAPEEHLTKVAAWGQTIGSISLIAGPAVAMLLLANASIAWVLLLDAIGAAIAITIVLLIAIPNPDKPAEPVATGYWVEMKAGLSALVQHSVVFRLTIGVTVVSVLYIPLGTYFPLMTRNHFGLGVIEAGIVEIAFAAGLIAGGMAMGVLGDRFNKIKTMAFGVALLGGALSFSGLLDAAYFYGFAAAAVVAGFSGPVFSSPFYAYVQSHIEPHLLGRVFGFITSLALLATPLGYVIAGAVLGLGGVAVLFAAIGAAILLSAFWILAAENNKKGATHVENNQNI